jgi:ankyrin repeat protein
MFKSNKPWKLMMLYFFVIIFSLSGYAAADPLHECAKEGDIQKVNLLIAQGADVNIIDENGLTPLHCAADQGHKKVVELLILKGANVNAVTPHGYTPLGMAAAAGHKDVMELLIKQGGHK